MTQIPGLISPDERDFLVKLAGRVSAEFTKPVFVDLGTYIGASSGCLRAGAAGARIFSIDVSDKRGSHVPDVEFLLGDSRKLWKDFQDPVHLIFLDGEHHYSVVRLDIRNWVVGKVVPGGYAAFHDANRTTGDFAYQGREIGRAIDEEMDPNEWEEIEGADSIRCFRRKYVSAEVRDRD